MIAKTLVKTIFETRFLTPLRAGKRWPLSKHYIKGNGLEIGSLHNPLPLKKGARAKNVDLASRADNIKQHPELDADRIVETDIIDDGFSLSNVENHSQDFIIANHVLEHAANTLQVLTNWVRVLKPNGILFISVPIGAKCFDRGRTLTTLQHFIDDHDLYSRGKLDEINHANRVHLMEWLSISEPNILGKRQPNYTPPTREEVEKRANEACLDKLEMHFHTFSKASFQELLKYFSTNLDKRLNVKTVITNRKEIIAIIRKQQ